MKLFLEEAALAPEDTGIWCRVYLRCGCRPERGVVAAARGDLRDASQMLSIEMVRSSALNVYRPKDYPRWPMVMTLMRANHSWYGLWDLVSES